MNNYETREKTYINNLSEMIQMETISVNDDLQIEKFLKFQELLKKLFPNIFNACEFQEFEGSFLMKWKGLDSNKNPIMFMNHQDVVAPVGDWKYDPFSGKVAEGKLWGRGTLDDKGGLWGMLQAADELAAAGYVPPRDIYFESACTEETSGYGADQISLWMQEQGIKLDMVLDEGGAIMYDPIGGAKGTFAMVGVGEKGCAEIKFIARGNGGHASTPGKNTPLVRLGKFMEYVERRNLFDVEMTPTICEMFKRVGLYMGPASKLLENPERIKHLLGALLPKLSNTANALVQTTIAFTMAQGSDARNTIPAEAWVIGNMRFSHHQGQEDSIRVIRKAAKKFDLDMEILDPGFESGMTDYNGYAFKLIEKAVKETIPGVDDTVPYIQTGASDSRYFDRVCNQCLRFMPFKIDDQQLESIHGTNESIDVSCLVPAVDFYRYLMQNC